MSAEFLAMRRSARLVQEDDTKNLPDGKYLVAILYHHLKPESIGHSTDLIWIKGHSKISVKKLKNAYLNKEQEDLEMPDDVLLMLDDRICDSEVQLKALDKFGDKFIVLRAIDPSTVANNDRKLPTTPSTREPLAPVQRQISANLLRDHDATRSPQLIKTESKTPKSSETPGSMSAVPPPCAPLQKPLHIHPTSLMQYSYNQEIQNPDHGAVSRQGLDGDNQTKATIPQDGTGIGTNLPSITSLSAAVMHSPLKVEPARSPSPDPPARDFFTASDSQTEEPAEFRGTSLQSLIKSESPELLERAVQKGMQFLDAIKSLMSTQIDHPDVPQWMQQMDSLQKQAVRTRTVVGVVGNTGAGKSSVINALLDEERLVPTNCMRACTAVVTEISWNDDDNDAKKYRAEIEFISEADWEKELNVLYKDMCDTNGEISREATVADTDAGVAYAKIRAVYPQRTREMLVNSNTTSLLSDKAVRSVLGKTMQVNEPRPETFYRRLQQYVDSKEKEDEGKDKKQKGEKKQMEYWPLIKCVKIFTKSDALSTGAVIVDLPGVQDSNAARAAVAEGYMKQCSGLWIVAPITRAVNDKAAKKLLGDQFKRQMKYDGMFSNITFICSKTDDISVTEAAESLQIEDQILDSWEMVDSLEAEKKSLLKNIVEYKAAQASYQEAFNLYDDDVDIWEKLQQQLEDGEQVFAPRTQSKKRKRKDTSPKPKKRINLCSDTESDADGEYGDDVETDSEADSITHSEDADDMCQPLTAEQIKEKLEELKESKREARKAKSAINKHIEETKQKTRDINEKIKSLKADMSAVCIAGRNNYSKGRIQEDFAQGIKELDQENAYAEDEANFDPEVDIQDYDKVAKSLPVFCVSSRAYQKMSGRLKKDATVPGFKTPEETEMPQLKAHCKKLTETGRISGCRVFINNLNQLLLSLSIWASNDGSGVKMTDEQRQSERGHLQKRLRDLESALDNAVSSCVKDIKETLADNIYNHFQTAHAAAQKAAMPTAQGWGAHRDSGGLVWATYKAICRRDGGPYSNAKGPHDFNKQLSEPMEKYLVSGWDKCFQRRMPGVMKSFNSSMTRTLHKFHDVVQERARSRGVGVTGLHVLSQKLSTWEQSFANLATQLSLLIAEKQKEANRELTPVIAAAMQHGYDLCVNEAGPGSFMRMKAHMLQHVETTSSTMFSEATGTVRRHLTTMCRQVEEQMEDQKDHIFEDMRKDYMGVIAGVKLPDGVMPRAERLMREEVGKKVKDSEEVFRRILEGESEETDEMSEESSSTSAAGEVENSTAPTSPSKSPSRSTAETKAEENGQGIDNDHAGPGTVNDSVDALMANMHPTTQLEESTNDLSMPDFVDDKGKDPDYVDDGQTVDTQTNDEEG